MTDPVVALEGLPTLIEKLEAVLFGDENTEVTHNDKTRDSISGAIKRQFAAIQAMVRGRKNYETLSLLLASSAPVADSEGQYPLAEVWGDTAVNNGLYGWDAAESKWVASSLFSDDIQQRLQRIVAYSENAELQRYRRGRDESLNPVLISGKRSVLSYNERGQLVFDPALESVRLIESAINDRRSIDLFRGGSSLKSVAHVVVSDESKPRILSAVRNDGMPYRVGDFNLFNLPVVHHLVTDGQSQSLGQTASPVLSDIDYSTPDCLLMPVGGVTDTGAFLTLKRAYLVSKESPAFGYAEYVVSSVKSAGYELSDTDIRFVISAPGVGGTKIEKFVPGGEHHDRWKTQVLQVARSAELLGMQYQNHAFNWTQGGTDINTGTSFQSYYDALILLRQSRESYLKSLVGEAAVQHAIIWQNGARVGETLDVPKAQYQASVDDEKIHLACPGYIFDYNDAAHLTNASSKALGHYLGRVYHQVVVQGRQWKPLFPTKIKEISSNKIQVDFHVPVGRVEFDRASIKSIPNEGFEVYDDTGRVDITSVSTFGGRRVLIELSRSLTANARLSYGEIYTGSGDPAAGDQPRGTLRDQAGYDDVYAEYQINNSGGPLEFNLHNYCVVFNELVERI